MIESCDVHLMVRSVPSSPKENHFTCKCQSGGIRKKECVYATEEHHTTNTSCLM